MDGVSSRRKQQCGRTGQSAADYPTSKRRSEHRGGVSSPLTHICYPLAHPHLRWCMGSTVRAVASVCCQEGALWATSEKQLLVGGMKMTVSCPQGMRHTLLTLAAAHGTSPLGVPVQCYTHLQFDCAVVGSSMAACACAERVCVVRLRVTSSGRCALARHPLPSALRLLRNHGGNGLV